MKVVYLIRHAKSSWSDTNCKDFDRDLNRRGKKDAKIMSRVTVKFSKDLDLVVSSKSVRTRKTTEIIFSEDIIKQKKIKYDNKLYHSSSKELLNYLSELSNNINSVALVSHNPGLTDLANDFANVKIDNLPTSGILAVEFDINKWSKILKTEGSLLFFDYPKNHKEYKNG